MVRRVRYTKDMKLISPAFAPNTAIPAAYTCYGDNLAPPLLFQDVPAAAKSLVLQVHDPDAPSGDFLHWLVWNIPPFTQAVDSTLPTGAVQGMNDFGKPDYGGPCPPSGMHRYIFELFALDTLLDEQLATRQAVLAAMRGHVLASVELIGTVKADA